MSLGLYRKRLLQALVVTGALAAPVALGAVQEPDGTRHFDARTAYNSGLKRGLSALQQSKVAELRKSVPELRVEHDSALGLVRSLNNPVGALSAPRSGDALAVGLAFVQSQRELLGLELEDIAHLEVVDRVYSRISGVTNLYLRQTYQGVPVYNGQLQINVDAEGRVLAVHSDFLPSLSRAISSAQPRLSAGEAVAGAARHLGLKLAATPRELRTELGPRQRTQVENAGISTEKIEAQLAVLPVRSGEARLVWNFQVYTADQQHAFDMTVDASTGEVWTRVDWVAGDTYRVYPRPVESPNHTSPLPPTDARLNVLNPANAIASPFGWHDTNGVAGAEYTIMRGNNVHAYEDANADGLPPAVQPDCGVTLNCNFAINLSGAPSTYTSAAVANLFYWNNIIHDIQYQYGFDELSGNFQVNNYGNGGLGNDDVRAEAQDGGGMNNANFLTPADGSRPRMQMYLWNTATPNRDGDLDSGVIVHEYGHGISNRLVGGPSNVSCLGNTQQPGEGISDFLALVYTAKATDTGPQGRGIGTYVLNQPTTGVGIRAQRYSTNPAVNTWTYQSLTSMSGPHAVGQVFAQAMWEAYWALVDRWGFNSNLYNATGSAGNQRMMLYFTQGLKNTPCSPTFTQVRDGIIQAATTLHSGEDVCRLWTAFANFGLGVDAVAGGPNTTAVTNGFNVPTACKTDVWGKDKPWDTGNQPDAATAANVMWESEDIWVRTTATSGPHQNPEYGQTNYVYVKVRNRSTTVAAHNVVVKAYGTNAATSTSWQAGWTEIGQATVVYLAPGASTDVVIPWSPPQTGHYCLLARMLTPQDPIHFVETVDPNFNTRLSNNIIWRNTNVVNLLPFGFVDVRFILRNVLREPRLYNFRFTELNAAGTEPFLARGTVTLDLGPELTQVWKASGGRAEGIKQVGETQFQVVDPTKAYFAIQLGAEQAFDVGMTFTDLKPAKDPQGAYVEYQFGVVQEDPQAKEGNPQVGGVTYYLQAGPLQ